MSERQEATELGGIEVSHKLRYLWAASLVHEGAYVLDACCGVGYGAYILAHDSRAEHIDAFDISHEAITKARKFYSHPIITHRVSDATRDLFLEDFYDVVTCFEAIEHLDKPYFALANISLSLKSGGLLLMSTPNVPFDEERFPEHVRHYGLEEMREILATVGFHILDVRYQSKYRMNFDETGDYMVIKAERR